MPFTTFGLGVGTLTGLEGGFLPPSGGGGVGIGAGLIAQHQTAAFDGPVNGQKPIDARQVVRNDAALRDSSNGHDANATIHVQSSGIASRPAPGIAHRKWVTQDDGIALMWYDTGAAWVPLATQWEAIANRPSTFPPAAHSAALITSGTLSADRLPATVVRSDVVSAFTVPPEFRAGAASAAIGTSAGRPDHAFLEFYPRAAAPTTRGGWLGYGSPGADELRLQNERPGPIELVAGSGMVRVLQSGALHVAARLLQFGAVTYTWPAAAGISGQVLTTDGLGGLVWATPAGGGGGGSVDWTSITNRPTTFPPSVHTHAADQVTAGTFGAGVILPAAQVGAGALAAGVTLGWAALTGIPATFTPSAHTHPWAQITGTPQTFPSAWATLEGRPSVFPPQAHRHGWSELDNVPATFPPAPHTHPWAQITQTPSSFPPSPHTHPQSDVVGLQQRLDALDAGVAARTIRNGTESFAALTVGGLTVPGVIISTAAPSGAAADGTLWLRI